MNRFVLIVLVYCFCALLRPAQADTPPPLVWGGRTQITGGGWGRMTPLANGDWVCVTTNFSKPHSFLQIQISRDKARTWNPLATVAEDGRHLDNGEVIALPNKTLLLTGRSVVTTHTPGGVSSYRLPVFQSADGGRTWAFLSQIATSEPGAYTPGQPSQGLWEPHFFLLADHSLACAYADETLSVKSPAFSQIVAEKVSRDGGRTWGASTVLAAQPGGGGQRPGMPVIARMKNGLYLAVYEVVGIGDADVYSKTSADGIHWTAGIGTPIAGQRAGSWVTCLQSGRRLVSSCENQISYSDDNGLTWQLSPTPAEAFGHVFSWPALYEVAPGQIAVMTSWHDVRIRWGQMHS